MQASLFACRRVLEISSLTQHQKTVSLNYFAVIRIRGCQLVEEG